MPTGGSCIRTADPTPRRSGARLAAIHGIKRPDCGRSPVPAMSRVEIPARSGGSDSVIGLWGIPPLDSVLGSRRDFVADIRDRCLTRASIKRRCGAHHGATLARAADPAIRIGGVIRRDFDMALEHGQDRAHEGHLSESFGNAIGDEISGLKSLWIKIEFERAFLTRLTYAFQDVLRMFLERVDAYYNRHRVFTHPRHDTAGLLLADTADNPCRQHVGRIDLTPATGRSFNFE
jgi:hypothetical protein